MNTNAMFKIGYGLYILTAKENGFDNGCVINTVTQVTSTPNRITVTVNKANKTHDMILATNEFNVSILTTGAKFELFKAFGFRSGKDVDKFESFKDFARAENGLPYITKHTNAYISAKVTKSIDVGTHIMFIAEVTEEKVIAETQPLTYADYISKVKPATKVKKGAWVCKVCGFAYMAENLPKDYICPICKHPATDFEWQEQ